MTNEQSLYRLNDVAHITGAIVDEPSRCICSVMRQQNMSMHDRIFPYLERIDLYHLVRLNNHWFWLDEPLFSAFIERWRLEMHTFHIPFGECMVTLQDVAFQLGNGFRSYSATYLPPNDGKDQRVINYRLALDRLTARDIVWEPYSALDVLAAVHPEILKEKHCWLWRAVINLIYFAIIKWHQVDRVVPQFGGVQHVPEGDLNID
ncbi:uncharacterized protein DS421_12g363210 [Arachis hypogaea]|nr:uncharacterized protein DS421_12g363210 [Arachis hypogaea]